MKRLLLFLLLGVVVLFTACTITTPGITNFEECVAAGHPVLETTPRQCNVGTSTFRENIREPIGGQTDDHGCLSGAGYSWDETAGACLRIWELNEAQKQAAGIAAADFEEEVTIVEVTNGTCADCYTVKLQRNTDRSLFTVSVNEDGVQWIANAIE